MSPKKKKIFFRVLLVIAVILLLFFLIVCFLIKKYLGKINYDHKTGTDTLTTIEETLSEEKILQELLAEKEATAESDSPQEVIASLESHMEQQLGGNVDADTEEKSTDNIFNILLVGCDSRTGSAVGRSDVMILFSVNENTQKIHMTSLLRDIYVSIPDIGYNRLNAAYAFGGGKLLLDTIETNFMVDVDKYVAFDFYSFIDIVDSMGGIDIEVTEAEIPVLNEYVKEINALDGREEEMYFLTEPGMQQLNGIQTLGYSRIRYVGNGDFARTERQRVVINKLFDKIKTINLIELNDLLNRFLPKIKTNLKEEEILSLAVKAVSYFRYDLDSFRVPVDGSYESMRINGMQVLGVDLKKNQTALQDYIIQ